jgi:phosphoribosylanthranilate isomerase
MTQVKICGLTNLDDALAAVEAGADLLGFIFYEASPRYVRPEVVKEIVAGVRYQVASSKVVGNGAPQLVGVFVNASLETVAQTLDDCHLDLAQLHGDESPEFVQHLHGRAFKALRPQSLPEAENLIEKYKPSPISVTQAQETFIPHTCTARRRKCPSPFILLDAYHPNLYGGAGQVTDWTMAATIAREYPILLAGGLTPENVVEAVRVVKPWGVDVSSGVEASKGRKDHEKVREFVRRAKDVKI